MNITAIILSENMKKVAFISLYFLISACATDGPSQDRGDNKFSSNPVINEIFTKSIETMVEKSRIGRDILFREYDPKYIETSTQICIAWFPIRDRKDRNMTLDDRLTYITCADNDASIEDAMEFHSFTK